MTQSDAQLSWWLHEARATSGEDCAPLTEDLRADVCIVGGGFTGLWTALKIKERDPGADVVLVESRTCGSGASGRNGGMALSWWPKLGTLIKLFGTEEGLRLAAASADAITQIGEFCDKNDIDAHFRHEGWFWSATNTAQVGSWDPSIETAAAHGHTPFAPLTPAQAAAMGGSDVHIAGVYEASGATLQPALLALGLRRVALERGVKIFENTPMEEWGATERGATVVTPKGTIRCDRVVLATNAWMVREAPIHRALTVVTSDMVVTRPIPELLERTGPKAGVGVSDSRTLVNYYRTTQDQRLAFGHGGGSFAFGRQVGRSADRPCWRTDAVATAMNRLYPQLPTDLVEKSWTGPIDRSISSLPFFGKLDDHGRVLYGTGYSGNGVGPSYLGGEILSSLALGLDDVWTRSRIAAGPVGTFPPEPAKYLGANVLRVALRRKERVEDHGKRPGPVLRGLSLLAPPGLIPVRRNAKPDEPPTALESRP